ncbi:FecR family protein [Chitinophaga sp. Hz27]|uniref:FecR family protein n=1 Tax=Chitinophaga sp. Hz27 TaxID=3347169 RepID=UPI0035DBF866
MSERYQQYSKQDFLDDDSFIRYIRGESRDSAVWEPYVRSAPDNLKALEDAADELRLLLTARRILPSRQTEEAVWISIQQQIAVDARQPAMRLVRRRWIAAAAAILLLIISSTAYYRLAKTTIHTDYGKVANIVLPDSSTIVLNSNSVISYKKYWKEGATREIWLQGEAFFEVRHLKKDSAPIRPGERFVVHTQQLDVEVLGTTFNVKARRGVTEVGLRYGAVQLLAQNQQQMRLKPGDVAQFSTSSGLIMLSPKAVVAVSAWKNHQLMMDNMSVREITHLLEDTYGYHSVITDTTILNKTVQGAIAVKNEDDIIFILQGILQMNIEKKDHQLIFKQHN